MRIERLRVWKRQPSTAGPALLAGLALLAAMAGCTPAQPDPWAQEQTDADRLEYVEHLPIDPDSTRMQGTWNAHELYLARGGRGGDQVCIVAVDNDDPSFSYSGCSPGHFVELSTDALGTVVYGEAPDVPDDAEEISPFLRGY